MNGTLPLITSRSDLRGKRVIIRASLDVPLRDGKVANYFRIARAMPTFTYLLHEGARIILVTHIGRDPKTTLDPLAAVLASHMPLTYVHDLVGDEAKQAVLNLEEGSVLLLENLRSNPGEESNDAAFAKRLASYADIYVSDAFAVAHRAHASIVGIPQYLPSYAGLTFNEEYVRLTKAMIPASPSLFILGGAKFETKQPLVKKYIETYDRVFIGGALANDFFKARGLEVGESLVSDADLSHDPLIHSDKIMLPIDVTVEGPAGIRITTPEAVHKDEKIYDAGPATVRALKKITNEAKTILWNGPVGNYEAGFAECTKEFAKLVAESHAYSVVGGGDTIAAIEALALNDQFSFLSTAGGAMLHYLEFGTLPGIEVILKKAYNGVSV